MRAGRLVEIDPDRRGGGAARSDLPAPYVCSDVAPYRSMRTGEMISGRAAHREHLKRFDLVEIGNERLPLPSTPGPAPGEIAHDIKRELARDPGERRVLAEEVLRSSGYDGPQITRIIGEG